MKSSLPYKKEWIYVVMTINSTIINIIVFIKKICVFEDLRLIILDCKIN